MTTIDGLRLSLAEKKFDKEREFPIDGCARGTERAWVETLSDHINFYVLMLCGFAAVSIIWYVFRLHEEKFKRMPRCEKCEINFGVAHKRSCLVIAESVMSCRLNI